MFDQITKHLEVGQNTQLRVRVVFNSLLGVWKCGQTLSFVFDILHPVDVKYRTLSIIPFTYTNVLNATKIISRATSVTYSNGSTERFHINWCSK